MSEPHLLFLFIIMENDNSGSIKTIDTGILL